MSLDKAILHGKERRNPVISQDSWCRNNGGCSWCESDRLHSTRKREASADYKISEWLNNSQIADHKEEEV